MPLRDSLYKETSCFCDFDRILKSKPHHHNGRGKHQPSSLTVILVTKIEILLGVKYTNSSMFAKCKIFSVLFWWRKITATLTCDSCIYEENYSMGLPSWYFSFICVYCYIDTQEKAFISNISYSKVYFGGPLVERFFKSKCTISWTAMLW
jgi:hypothetical protein